MPYHDACILLTTNDAISATSPATGHVTSILERNVLRVTSIQRWPDVTFLDHSLDMNHLRLKSLKLFESLDAIAMVTSVSILQCVTCRLQ